MCICKKEVSMQYLYFLFLRGLSVKDIEYKDLLMMFTL